MKIWTDRSGKAVEGKEFFQRWKQGIAEVTPYQQKKMQLFFTWLTVIGILCGIVVSIWQWETLWWLCIILVAGLGNTLVSTIGVYQQYKILKSIEKAMKGGENEDEQKSTN